MPDLGFTHLALAVSQLDRSVAFYESWTDLRVVHARDGVAWLSDATRPFALVLAERHVDHPLAPFSHLGFAVESEARVHELAERARTEGILREGPNASGPPVGTWCFLSDPDGHVVEFSFGQEVERSTSSIDTRPPGQLPRVAVIGSGSDRHESIARPLGAMLARRNVDLVCGGGAGVMEAVAEGFVAVSGRAGRVIGILPAGPPPGYPNEFIEVAIHTHLPARGEQGRSMESRNHIVVLSADAVIALPGGAGTDSERALAGEHCRPLIEVDSVTDLDDVQDFLRQALRS